MQKVALRFMHITLLLGVAAGITWTWIFPLTEQYAIDSAEDKTQPKGCGLRNWLVCAAENSGPAEPDMVKAWVLTILVGMLVFLALLWAAHCLQRLQQAMLARRKEHA